MCTAFFRARAVFKGFKGLHFQRFRMCSNDHILTTDAKHLHFNPTKRFILPFSIFRNSERCAEHLII